MYPSLELLGRRMTVIISDTIFIMGAILCTVPTHQIGLVYAGRFFTGMGVGGIAAVSPIYIAEISPPAIRGRLTGFFESFYQTGAVIGFWINYGIVHNMDRSKSIAWRVPMAVQLIPAGLLALMIPLLKESPTWLLKRGRKAEALKVYSFFRNLPEDHEYIAQDVKFVEAEIARERAALVGDQQHPTFPQVIKAAAKEAAQPGMRNRFLLVFLMFMWQAWSGAAGKPTNDFFLFAQSLIFLQQLITIPQPSSPPLAFRMLLSGPVCTELSRPAARLSSSPGSLTCSAANTPGSFRLASVPSASTIWRSISALASLRLANLCLNRQSLVARERQP